MVFKYQKLLMNRRFWRIPVMHGEFIVEETTGVTKAIGGGKFSRVS